MRVSIILVISLLYVGCSTKEVNYSDSIQINKDGGLLFYAYMEDGDKLTRVSKELVKPKNDEEIIRVYKNGYYPIYSKKEEQCGYNLAGFIRDGDIAFCKSNYVELDSVLASTIANIVALPLGVINSTIGGSAVFSNKVFSSSLLKEAISSSSLPKIKNIVSSNLTVLERGVLNKRDILSGKY